MLAGYDGPQAGRLAELYANALGQLLGVDRDELAVTPELTQQLVQIGLYSATVAPVRIALLKGAERAEMETSLGLSRGHYPEAVKSARDFARLAPSPLSKALSLAAALLSGDAGAARELLAIERDGGAAGALASFYLRRAARESLALRLSQSLSSASPAVRKAAAPWRRPGGKSKREPGLLTDQPLREACGLLLGSDADVKRLPRQAVDCAYLLSEGTGSAWAARELPLPAGAAAKGPEEQRVVLLNLARALGMLLGLPGKPPSRDAKDRSDAVAEVARLLPDSGLGPEDGCPPGWHPRPTVPGGGQVSEGTWLLAVVTAAAHRALPGPRPAEGGVERVARTLQGSGGPGRARGRGHCRAGAGAA
jgi:hypothetical protein